jgi:hypothetical protein
MTHDEVIAFLDHRRQAYEARDVNALVAGYAVHLAFALVES